MTKYYEVPFLSRVAGWVAFYLLPVRIHAWIWITAYQDLDDHYRDVDHHNPDGSRHLFSAVSAVQVENLMRRMWREQLKATVDERGRDQKTAS